MHAPEYFIIIFGTGCPTSKHTTVHVSEYFIIISGTGCPISSHSSACVWIFHHYSWHWLSDIIAHHSACAWMVDDILIYWFLSKDSWYRYVPFCSTLSVVDEVVALLVSTVVGFCINNCRDTNTNVQFWSLNVIYPLNKPQLSAAKTLPGCAFVNHQQHLMIRWKKRQIAWLVKTHVSYKDGN